MAPETRAAGSTQDGEPQGPPDAPIGLLAQLREDVRRNDGLLRPGTQAVVAYRLGAWSRTSAPPWARTVTRKLTTLAHVLVRNAYGIELPPTAELGRRVKVAHQSGIVIHPHSRIGDDCTLRQGVTLGAAIADGERFAAQAPVLGRGVSVGAGAVVVGAVTIGDGAVLGPNVVVLTNVGAGSRVLAPPPRTVGLPAAVLARQEGER
ncbi:serine O-acetyltransferase [Kineococcus rubinsiae]|uniref:serine O-acetyltransferase n=1 Tax=Kineococcus rubinsiae TaxID=2609562 RepID=UPI001AD92935|nr:hypothetical protein [Kineococcus rubinsiae]